MIKLTDKERADAAEKTVAILMDKVIELYNDGAQSTIHRQLEKSRQRDEENKRKRELMEVRNQELQKYSETLENEVNRRTDEMKTILNNVTFGFLTVDRSLNIRTEYTHSCESLFGTNEIAGRKLTELLALNERGSKHYELGVDQIFEDIMPEFVTLHQIPSKFYVKDKVLRVEGSVVRGKSGEVSAILYTISDHTSLEQAQNEANLNRALIEILRQKDSFQFFLEDAKKQLTQARQLLSKNSAPILRRIIHTIKGNSASYGLTNVVNLIHQIEDGSSLTNKELDIIQNAIDKFLQDNYEILGISFDQFSAETVEVGSDKISDLRSMAEAVEGPTGERIRSWAQEVTQKPASVIIGPIECFASRLADRLDKKIAFSITGENTLVDMDTTRGVLQTLIHLVRNAIDHGIENPNERAGKNSQARVSLRLMRTDHEYVFEVEDDGRGIDINLLTQKAIEKNLITKEELKQMSDDEKFSLIFRDGFSSAEETTDISGRGVGMSAVKSEVQKAGGELHIDSHLKKGTLITINIPIYNSARSFLKKSA